MAHREEEGEKKLRRRFTMSSAPEEEVLRSNITRSLGKSRTFGRLITDKDLLRYA
jgi:hypothetical protein